MLDLFKAKQGERIGGYGEGSDPFNIPGLPGAGGSAHEWGQIANFEGPVSDLNRAIQALLPNLPVTGGIGGAGIYNPLWSRIQDQDAAAMGHFGQGQSAPGPPTQMLARMPDGSFKVVTQGEYDAYGASNLAALQAAQAGTGDMSAVGPDWAVAENVFYGDPRYNYAAQGITAPDWTPGPMSAAWQQLMGGALAPSGQAATAPTAPTAAPMASGPQQAPGPIGQQIDEYLRAAAARQ